MYRIAMDCGLINNYNQKHFCEAVAALENLTDDAQLFLKAVLGVVAPSNYGTFWVEYDEDREFISDTSWHNAHYSHVPLEWLSSNPYLDIVPVSWQRLSINEITEILSSHNISLPDELEGATIKDDLVRWIEKNIPKHQTYLPRRIYVYAIFHQRVMFNVLTYLNRKFDWNTYYFADEGYTKKVVYPCGAKFDDSLMSLFGDGLNSGKGTSFDCHFPNDEITELLTLYDHNRCQNGFKATAE